MDATRSELIPFYQRLYCGLPREESPSAHTCQQCWNLVEPSVLEKLLASIELDNYGFLVFLAMTEDGYESHFQVNHLSHFLLTLELLPLMVDSAQLSGDGRIVIVSSMMHSSGVFAPGNLNAERSYSRTQFYSSSKLFNVSD